MTDLEKIKELKEIKFNTTIKATKIVYPKNAHSEEDGWLEEYDKDITYSLYDYAEYLYEYKDSFFENKNISKEDIEQFVVSIKNIVVDDLDYFDRDFKEYLEEHYGRD